MGFSKSLDRIGSIVVLLVRDDRDNGRAGAHPL
jgi:hypothetical protein